MVASAILAANANIGADFIHFNIPGNAVPSIQPNIELPEITDPVTIDGYSQPGAARNTRRSSLTAERATRHPTDTVSCRTATTFRTVSSSGESSLPPPATPLVSTRSKANVRGEARLRART